MMILASIFAFFTLLLNGSFESEVEQYLNQKLKGYEKISFEIISLPKTKGGEEIRIDEERDFKVAGNMAYLPVMLVSRGRKSLSVATLKLKLYQSVLTARSAVVRGTEIDPSVFELKTMEISQLRGKPVTDFSALTGLKARMHIREGEVLVEESLEALPVIKRGDRITAFAGSGNVIISIDASAREDGRVGQVIRIETADNKILRARVIDQYTARIND